jgi:hypothetical protein
LPTLKPRLYFSHDYKAQHRHISLQVAIIGAIVDPTQNMTLSQLTLANTAKQKVVKLKV